MKLLYATNNPAKVAAMQNRIRELGIELIGFSDLNRQIPKTRASPKPGVPIFPFRSTLIMQYNCRRGHEDQELIAFHKEMIRIHKENPEILSGSLKYVDGAYNIVGYGSDIIH